MADDVSKKYALNIEVNVDSSSLNNLKNIQEPSFQTTPNHQEDAYDVFEKLFDSPKVQNKQTQPQHSLGDIKELSTKLSEISNKVDGIKSELEKRDTSRHSEHIVNASNLATSDIARSVAVQIMSAINDGISPVLSSGMFKTSHMSAGEVQTDSKSGQIDSSGIQKKIAATTGKKVTVHESQMPSGEYGEYEHGSQVITINSGKSTPVKKLALNHEATHTVQEAKGYTGNTQLFHANANTPEFDRNQSRYVNEYLTNTAAIIRTALADGLDESSLKQAVEAYKNAIYKTSGVVIKDIKSFTETILKMSSLNISPETFMANFGNDVVGLGLGDNGITNLSKAAMLAGYHIKSDGSIRNQNGKLVSDNQLLRLTDENGKRINQSDIVSHRMAYFVSNSANTLRGASKFNGRNAFLRSAGTEFFNMSDFGVQFMPAERLERINSRRQWQGLSYSDIQRRVRENTAHTHRGETLYTEEEAINHGSTLQTRLRNPGNVQFGLQSPLEKIMFAIGGKSALDSVRGNVPSGYGSGRQEILDYIKSYIFEGTGTNEEQFQLASYKRNADGMTTTTKLGQNYGKVMDSITNQLDTLLESGDLNNSATFIGTNAMNTRLGDLAFYARALKRGVKAGYIPDTVERVKLQQSEIKTNKDGDQVDTIENAELGHLSAEQLSQGEEIDLRNYERKRLAYERAKKAVASAREKFNALRLGGSSSTGLIGANGSTQIMIGSRQVSSIEDIDRIERGIESEFANYQRENPEIAKKEAVDNMLTSLRGIIGVLHGGEDARKISTEQLEQESRAVIDELNAIPDFLIEEAKKRNSTIKLAGVDVGIDGIVKTREAIKEYQKTMRNISSGGMFSPSKMAEEEWDPTKDLEDTNRQMRKRRIELAKDYRISREDINNVSIMAPILRQDPTYQDLRDQREKLKAYIRQQEKSYKERVDAQKKAEEKHNADLRTPTSYERTVNGETVERNVKFDKNEASVMGSVYEKDYGAYNMAVGNLEALSTTTQAPLATLKKIRRNRSYMNFVGDDGNIQDFASPLTSAMSQEAILRMRMLENPLKRILETSGSISGNAPKRVDATRDMLADYLHRGETGARHQLGSFEEFLNKFKSILDKYGAKDTTVDESKAKELYSAIKDFNERSILSKSGLSNIDASVAKRNAEEMSGKDILDLRNRMLMDDTKSLYDKEILDGEALLKKAGISINDAPIDDKYKRHQYKLVSDESKEQGDMASGSSVANKDDLNGAALYLHKMGRTMNPYSLEYKEGLSVAHYNLEDLSKYTQEEIAKMIRATQAQGLKNTKADLIEVTYEKGGKKKTELTARNNDVFSDIREMSATEAFTKGIRERYFVEHANNMARGTIGSSGQVQTNDVIRTFSDNMRKIVERALNGGASSETIKRIAEDVSVIKGILSNGDVAINSANTQKTGGMFETSKMAAEDSAIDHSIEAERQRRIEAAMNAENEYSNLYEDETARATQRVQTDDSSAQKRLEKSEFEAKLSELSSKREKLAFIDEKINSMNSGIDSMSNEDRLKVQIEINRLRKKRVAIENGPGTKEDKLEFNEWRDSLRSRQKELISNLRGKGYEDISRAVSEEVKRLLNLEENRSVGNYDKKSEIQKLITKLKEFEQSSRIKSDKNSLSDAINELKRKYKGEDNAFDATLKGAGVDDRPEKLRKEVERLNSVLDELKIKKEEALNAIDEVSAKFYDTLIFQRQTRKDVVQGKQNAADKALRIANENAAARAVREAERAQKQEQKRLDAMAAAHDKEGNQARSVFNKAVEYGAMSTLVYGFASEAKNAIDVMARFERQMVEVTKVMDPLYQSQELLTESAKRMAVQYGVSIIESAKGMAVFAQQGKNAAQIIQLTEASLLAANTTTLNAAQATEALTATIRQFNLTDSDAKRIIDSWLEVESRTAISAQTMADAIKISGTAARVAGLSFDEFNGILSAVGSATRETGSQLGTAFKFIISKMRTDDAVTALNRLGVATHNQNGDYRDLMVVLSDLNSKWVEMSQEQKASTAIAIAGTRRYNTLMTLMEKWDDALEAVSMSEDSHGKAMRMNAAVMDTYEKKVQKARASVEAFYASMSKGTTKGFLGGIQESISIFAGIGEKTPLASGLAQAGIVASGISFFSRMGGSMGLGTALGDLKANSEIKSEISKAIASEVKSSIGSGKALFRSHSSRKAALDRLDMIDSGKNVSSKINKESKFLDGRDILAEKIATRIAGVNKESEIYQSTLKRVQNEISRTIASHKNYIEKLENHTSKVGRFGVAAGEFAKKHATVIAAIGIGLQTLANSEFFKDEKSLTGKTTAGEVIDLAGSLGTAIGAGAAASQFGGPWAGVAVGALSMLGPLVSNLQSWGEKITGSTRLTLLRLQEESDRLKTLTTSIDSYSRLREKERSGQALTLEEQEQKRVLEQNISLASPTAIKIGHRGVGSSIDEGEFEKLVGRKTEFKDKYASISDQMAYEQMFSQTFGGKTISEDLRKNLFTEQKALDVQLSKLRDFDAKHTGELSESEHSDRMKIIEEIKKIQERIGKGNTAINEVEQAFFAAVRNRESGVLNATRRGESYEANDGPNYRIRKMFEQIVANRNGNISEARKVTSEAILSGIISRGTIKNRTTAIEHAQITGMLYSATRGRELEGGKQEIILHTRAADGSVRKSESIIMDKKGSDDDYIREVATRKGLDARSIAYTSELSDTLFRYSLKEVEKFSELTRKIGDTIYNSYKAEVDRINSIEGISSKFRIGGIDSQYRGSDIRLEEALRATSMRAKSAGSVDSELIKKMADYAKNNNPSKAMFAGAEISSQIARHNTLAGATEHLVMSMSTQVQKANMANQIIEAIYRASFKTERGRDGEVADIGGEEKRRINEYLAMAGLGFDEFDKIRHSLGSEASEEDFKRALMSRVSAAADIMAKKDSDDISKYFKMLEDNVERLANIMKQTAEAMEINRKDSFAANLDYSGMVFDRDIVNSYKGMAAHASMYDDEITKLSAVVEASRSGVDIQENAVEQALKARDEAIAKYGRDSQQAITANDNYLRLRNNYDQALSSLNTSLEKLDNLKGLQQQLKAMATGSFGEHRAFMRTVESSAIGESTRNGNISFGVGSSDYNNISLLAEQNRVLSDRRMDIQSQYDTYAQMAKDGKLTEAQKTEMKSLELQLGEIDKAIRENGMKLDTANMNLEKTYAEARRNTRRLQLEHLANALSGSKDTGRSQKAMFDDSYNRMRGLWRDYVSAMQQNPNAVSEDQKQYMKELAKKMENLRDIGDLMGNPAFNKNYLLASAQDQAIADNIMQRLQSGETMKQIFSDAGMKEMGRNNPLISQLMDNMMQKQENQRLADISNQMLDVETEMLGYLKSIAGLMNNPMFRTKIEEGGKSNREAKKGFASGTTLTGSGGKFESAGLVEIHKGEGLGVLSQTAMARYPMMSRKVLQMISDMNLGTYPGFANGTRDNIGRFIYDVNYSVGNDINGRASYASDNAIRQIVDAIKNGTAKPINEKDINPDNASSVVDFGGNKFIIPPQLFKSIMSIDKNMALVSYSMSKSGLVRDVFSIKNVVSKSSVLDSEILKEAKRIISYAPISGKKVFNQNIGTNNGEAEIDHNGTGVTFRYGKSYNEMTPVQKAMVRVHEEAGHGSTFTVGKNGKLRYDYQKTGVSVPEFFADTAAIAVGRRPFIYSGYQTGASHRLANSVNLPNKKTAVDAYLAMQEGQIANPAVVREQLAHIQSEYGSDFRTTVSKKGFMETGERALIPFIKDAEARGDSGSARKLRRNLSLLTDSVFGKSDSISILDGILPNVNERFDASRNSAKKYTTKELGFDSRRFYGGVRKRLDSGMSFSEAVSGTAYSMDHRLPDDLMLGVDEKSANMGIPGFKEAKTPFYRKDLFSFDLIGKGNRLKLNRWFTSRKSYAKAYKDYDSARFNYKTSIDNLSQSNLNVRDKEVALKNAKELHEEFRLREITAKKNIGRARDRRLIPTLESQANIRANYSDTVTSKHARNTEAIRNLEQEIKTRTSNVTSYKAEIKRLTLERDKLTTGASGREYRVITGKIGKLQAEVLAEQEILKRKGTELSGRRSNQKTLSENSGKYEDIALSAVRRTDAARMSGKHFRKYSPPTQAEAEALDALKKGVNNSKNSLIRAEIEHGLAVSNQENAKNEVLGNGKRLDQARAEYVKERAKNIRRIRLNKAPGRILNKVGGTIDNFAGSATNAAFAMMSLKGAIDNGKMFFTGKRFNKDTGEYEALTDFEKGQTGFNAASNASFFMSQVIGGKHAKASKFFGGAGSALSMASAVHNMANGNVAQGILQLTQAAMFNPQLRNFATNKLGKTAFGQKVLQKMPRMGKSYGYGAALQMGGDLLASQFEEGSNAWVASKLASEAGTAMQFMTPAGAVFTGGMNTANELINLGGWDGEGGNEAYKIQTGKALEALSRRNGDSGSWYSSSTVGYASDTVLGGLIGTRERAHRAAVADMKSKAAAGAIDKNTIKYNEALKTSRDIRDNATIRQKEQAALAAVELQNSFFKQHTGLKDDKLIDKDSAAILAMTGVGVDDMFSRYGWSTRNRRIAENSKFSAKHKAEAEMHRQNAKTRTLSKAWGEDENDRAKANAEEDAAAQMRLKSKKETLEVIDNKKLQAEARQKTQEYFDAKYGRKADVYGENGLLVKARKAERDEEIKKERASLASNEKRLADARKDFFDKNIGQFPFSSLEEMEHRARLGDEKAKKELKIFEEKSKSHKYGSKSIEELRNDVKQSQNRISELQNKKIDSSGKVTAKEFLRMDAVADGDFDVKITKNARDKEKTAARLKEAEEDLENMKGVSSNDAIAKKKAEIESLRQEMGQHDKQDLQLKTKKAINEKIKSGKLKDPKKLAQQLSGMETEAKDAQAALDDSNVLRELKKNGKATVTINGEKREVTRDDLVRMADKNGSKRDAVRKTAKDSQAALERETETEYVRQQLIKENGGDASKVTPEMVEARKKEIKENQRKEAEKRENERQDRIYSGTVFGKREAAQKAYDDSIKRRDSNRARIAELEKREKSGEISEKEKEELREAKNMQTYYDRAVDRREGDLNRANRAIVERQRAARKGLGGDTRLMGLSKEDYEKERANNEKRIKELEGKQEADTKRKAELEAKQKSGKKLNKEEQTELDRINSNQKELSRRKNMTRTMFAETDLRKFKRDKSRLEELRQKKADGKTLTADEQKEFDTLGKQDFSKEAEQKLVDKVDEEYKNKNGGMSFGQLEEEAKKERRKITLDNLGLKAIKYNEKTGRYEAEDDRQAPKATTDERADALSGEDSKATADAYTSSTPRTAGVTGTSQTTQVDDKNVANISKDTATMVETITQILERLAEIMKLIPSGGESESSGKKGLGYGSVLPGADTGSGN